MRKWPTNVGDVRCQQLSQGRALPTNQRDPPKLINCNELRGGDCRYSSAVRHGNWFEQRVFESGYQNGVGPALAPFIKDGLPFQTSPEQALFHSTQGRFRTEQTERYINPPDYVGPSAQMQKANDTHFKATMQSNPTSDFNMLNAAENPGNTFQFWKMVRNSTSDMHPDLEGDDFYRTSAADIGSGKMIRMNKTDGDRFANAKSYGGGLSRPDMRVL